MPPGYGQPIDVDEEARKQKSAENPLVKYFGADSPTKTPAAPVTQAAPAAPAATQATNVGPGANTGAAAQRRPAPTSFTNFSRVQGANKDASTRQAQQYGARATLAGTQAQTSLGALKARFGGQLAAGTVAAPGEADGPGYDPDNPNADSNGIVGPASDLAYANAEKGYTGPAGLGEIEGVDDTVASMLGAQQGLNALGDDAGGMQALIQQQNPQGTEGTSKLSAALVGSAGRKDFDALRARFNPEADFDKADAEAMAQATAAGESSTANAGAWRELGDKSKVREDAMSAQAEAARKKDAEDAATREKDKQWQADFAATDKGEARLGAKTVFEYLDPINYVSGGKRGFGMKFLGDTFGEDYKGNISWTDSPLDKDVYSQMDAAQWDELSQLTGVAQRNWINRRAAELKNKTGRARGTYQGHRPTGGS
jgi:hypothetical protein